MKIKKLRKFIRRLLQDLTVVILFCTAVIELIKELCK